MMTTTWRLRAGVLACGLLLFGLPAGLSAQGVQSAPLARDLAQRLEKAGLDSIAAKDLAEEDRYVAALYFPGQLLVVSARYAAPVLLDQRLQNREYREVYIDLNSAAVPDSRVFVIDLGADGLVARPESSQPYDSFDGLGRSLSCNGDWQGQNMSEQQYMETFAQADAQYAAMLSALLAGLKADSF